MDTQVETYVAVVLALYRRLLDVVTRPRRQDRHLTLDLHRRGVSLALIETALALATARRRARPDDAAPLSPMPSLHYYLSVIEELLTMPPACCHLDYLRDHLADLAPGTRPEKDLFG